MAFFRVPSSEVEEAVRLLIDNEAQVEGDASSDEKSASGDGVASFVALSAESEPWVPMPCSQPESPISSKRPRLNFHEPIRELVEKYFSDNLDKLSRLKAVSKKDRTMLEQIAGRLVNNEDLRVEYKPGTRRRAEDERLYAQGPSAQHLPSNFRRIVLLNTISVDVVNCAATILWQLLQSHGVRADVIRDYSERRAQYLRAHAKETGDSWAAGKKAFLAIIYDHWGGFYIPQRATTLNTFKEEVATIRAEATTVGELQMHKGFHKRLEMEERKVMEAIVAFYGAENVRLTVHDAVFVDYDAFNETELTGLVASVENTTGYSLRFAVDNLDMTSDDERFLEGDKFIKTEVQAASFVVEQFRGHFLWTDFEECWAYDPMCNTWTDRGFDDVVYRLMHMRSVSLGSFLQKEAHMQSVFRLVRLELRRQMEPRRNWKGASRVKWKGTLPFKNGYVCFSKNGNLKFEKGGWDMGFRSVIPREFDTEFDHEKMQDLAEMVRSTLFQCVTGPAQDFLILSLARALFADTNKEAFFVTGPTDCGKGTITKAMRFTFGSLVDTFDATGLTSRRYRKMPEKELALKFLVRLSNCRLAISNELDSNEPFSSTIFKQLVSGGDEVDARVLHANTSKQSCHFAPFFFSQDGPTFDFVDFPLFKRIYAVFATRGSTSDAEFDPVSYFREDKAIDERIMKEHFQLGLIFLMIGTYQDFLKRGRVVTQPDEVQNAKLDIMPNPKTKVEEWVRATFIFTKDSNDKVHNKKLKEILPEGVRSVNAIVHLLRKGGAWKPKVPGSPWWLGLRIDSSYTAPT